MKKINNLQLGSLLTWGGKMRHYEKIVELFTKESGYTVSEYKEAAMQLVRSGVHEKEELIRNIAANISDMCSTLKSDDQTVMETISIEYICSKLNITLDEYNKRWFDINTRLGSEEYGGSEAGFIEHLIHEMDETFSMQTGLLYNKNCLDRLRTTFTLLVDERKKLGANFNAKTRKANIMGGRLLLHRLAIMEWIFIRDKVLYKHK